MKYIRLLIIPITFLFVGFQCRHENPPADSGTVAAIPKQFASSTTIISVPTPSTIQITTAPTQGGSSNPVQVFFTMPNPDPTIYLEKANAVAGPYTKVDGMYDVVQPNAASTITFYQIHYGSGVFPSASPIAYPQGFFSGQYFDPANGKTASMTAADQFYLTYPH